MKLILASASPRRKELLKNAGYDFEVIASNYDEKLSGQKYSGEMVKNCAYNKALDVFNKQKGEFIIISADTVVVNDDIILGKPKDYDEASEMLKSLSDKTHFVATAVCLLGSNGKLVKGIDITYVSFRKLDEDEISSYILYHNPLDKAGSYGIQDKGFNFALEVNGELDNVIGFPVKLFEKLLEEFKG